MAFQNIRIIAAFAIALSFMSLPARSENVPAVEKEGAPLCWSNDDLRFKDGEQLVRKRVPASRIAPPQGAPTNFTPIAQRGVVRRVNLPAGKKLVALTFDLCETPDEIAGYQGDVVDILRKFGIRATFFAGGKWLLNHPERAAQLLADPLFSVENHTWAHRNLRLLAGRGLAEEIGRATLAYDTVRDGLKARSCVASDRISVAARASRPQTLFRFPFGACNAQALDAVAAQGLTAVQWDVSSGDPSRNETPQMMKRGVLANVVPGSIVLFHANGRGYNTAAALPGIIEELKKQNYGFVTVTELLQQGEPVYASSCYDNRPGDTDRYDRLARHLAEQHTAFEKAATGSAAPASPPKIGVSGNGTRSEPPRTGTRP